MRELVFTELLRGTVADRTDEFTQSSVSNLKSYHATTLSRQLASAGFSSGAKGYVALSISISIAGYLAASIVNMPYAIPLCLVVLLELLCFVPRECAVRRSLRAAEHLPEFLEVLARNVSEGDPIDRSFIRAAKALPSGVLSDDLRAVQDRMMQGVGLAEALHELGDLRRIHDFRSLAISVHLFSSPGGADGEALRQVAAALRRYRGRLSELDQRADTHRVWALVVIGLVALFVGGILMQKAALEVVGFGLPLLVVSTIIALRATSSVCLEGYE